jgi:group I intron endonuclease
MAENSAYQTSGMAQGIYCWLNILNGKVYAGSGQDLDRRKTEHIRFLNAKTHPNLHLQAAWNKYGAGVFEFMVLEEVEDLLWLRARESAWILRLQASDPTYGYNHTGDGWSPSPSTPEARAALRKAWIKRKVTFGMPAGMVAHNFQKGHVPANKGKTYKFKKCLHKASWTPERRAAQAVRLAVQRKQNPTMASQAGAKGAAKRWNLLTTS